MDKFKISILLVTYNHQEFISEAIESILMQNLSYDYEIVVADDCSTDNTINIINSFDMKHPGLFRFLKQEENLGITKNYQRGFFSCNSEYIAVLEGDDRWTSPKRLQIMVDFLENNRGCSMAFNRFIVSETKNKRFNVQPWAIHEKFQLIVGSDLAKDNFIGNFSTCVYRREMITKIDNSLYEMKVYDWMFNIVIAQYGLIGYIPEVMSLYRLHATGTWTQKSEEQKINETISSIDEYNSYLNFIYDSEFTEHKNRLLNRLHIILNPGSMSKKEKLKNRIKAYLPPIVIVIAKSILPPKIIELLKNK